MKKILIALVAIFALTQCKPAEQDSPTSQTFATQVQEFGLYNKTTPIYAYDIEKHQTSVTRTPAYRFVMQSDDQSEYLVAKFTALPDVLKVTVDVDVKVVGGSGFKEGIRNMELVKIDEEKAWLWNEDESLGLVVAVPSN